MLVAIISFLIYINIKPPKNTVKFFEVALLSEDSLPEMSFIFSYLQ